MDQQNNENYQPSEPKKGANVFLIIITIALLAIIAALIIVIVSQKNGTPEETETEQISGDSTDSQEVLDPVNYSDYYTVEYDENFVDFDSSNINDYVTIGQYKGIEITLLSAEVTDEDIQERINKALYNIGHYTKNDVTDAIVKGDIVSLDYVGKFDGVEFEGGTGSKDDLTIGSGAFIPGFEDGLIGSKTGDIVTVNCTFPEVYSNNPDYAGKEAEFTCTIKKVQRITYDELNSEILSELGDYNSIDDYKAVIRDELEIEKSEASETQKKNDIWSSILNSTTFIKYPKSLLDSYMQEMIDYYTSYAAQYGYSLNDYVVACQATLSDFYTSCATYAVNAVNEQLIINAIVEAENIMLSEEEYNEGALEYCELYSFEDIASLEESFGKELIERSLTMDKVMDFLVDSAVIKA